MIKIKKTFITIGILLTVAVVAKGKRIVSITEDFFKTPMLRVDDSQLYIVDQELKKGFIYDRTTLKKVAQFGGPGQGPGEFTGISYFTVDDKYIYVTNFPKLSIFSKKGEFVREIKLTLFTAALIPIGDHFIGHWFPRRAHADDLVKIQFSLYDANFKKKRDIFFTEIEKYADVRGGKKIIYKIRDYAESFVYKDRIYIGNTGLGIYFSVFDKYGNKLYDIKKDVKLVKIPGDVKKWWLKEMRKNMGEAEWNTVKVIIRDYLPAYLAFFVSDDKIFVFRCPQRNYEIFILDLNGNLLKKQYIPTVELFSVSSRYDCMHNGILYNLIDMHDYWDIIEIDIFNYEPSVDVLSYLRAAWSLYTKVKNNINALIFF